MVCHKLTSPTTGKKKDSKTQNFCPKCKVFSALVLALSSITLAPLCSAASDSLFVMLFGFSLDIMGCEVGVAIVGGVRGYVVGVVE